MADFFSITCNSALRAAPARPPDTGDTAGRLRGPRGGRERAPGVPAALATVGPFLLVVGLKRKSSTYETSQSDWLTLTWKYPNMSAWGESR